MDPIIVTTCSNRKRDKPSALLTTVSLPRGALSYLLNEWTTRINRAEKKVEAKELYTGRGFLEIKKLAEERNIPFHIISAGMGLISATEKVPSYDLTVAGNGSVSVLNKLDNDNFDPRLWWNGINRSKGPNPLANLIRSKRDRIVLISLTNTYYGLVESDLLTLDDTDLKRVRITGLKAERVSSKLERSILPYNINFDGPNSPLPGTRSDFPQRTCVHYIRNVLCYGFKNDRSRVSRLMKRLSPPRQVTRKRLSDREILQIMKSRIRDEQTTSAKMLRYLRDDRRVACEQTRCSQLYKLALER